MHNWKARAYDYDLAQEGFDEYGRSKDVQHRDRVIQDEVDDYNSMREVWTAALEHVRDSIDKGDLDSGIDNLNRLALARQRIDALGRKSSELPTSYKDSPSRKSDDDEEMGAVYLDWNEGPKRVITEDNDDNNSATAPREPRDSSS